MVTVARASRSVAPVASHRGWAVLTPVTRPELAVTLEMTSGVIRSGLGARWEEVERPMRESAQDYVGIDLERQAFSVLFEGAVGNEGEEPASVQPQIAAMLALGLCLPGEYAPPALNVDGPLQGRRGAMQWQLQSATQSREDWRREAEGYVWSSQYDLVLAKYVALSVITSPNVPAPSPAAAAAAAAPGAASAQKVAASGRTYTVRAGDNLNRIAQSQLGSASRWREIATLNALKNPNVIRPGQVLRLP
jgi:LysM repeat protein